MKKRYINDKRLLFRVSDLYYNSKMTQEEISEKLELSRPTISKMLKKAKDEGIVRIQVINPLSNNYTDLEKRLEETLGLKEVVVIDSFSDNQKQIEELGKAGAEYLERILNDGDLVGVSMGRTMQAVARASQKAPQNCDIKIFPLVGGMGQMRTDLHCNQIVLDLNRAFGGEYYLLHAPAYIADNNLKESLRNESHIKHVFDLMDNMNVALVGIGGLDEECTIKQTGYCTSDEIAKMKERGIVGDICAQVFDSKGNVDDDFNKNIFGYKIANLRGIDKRIGVSGAGEKIDVICGAVLGGFINILITDYSTAQKVLEKYDTIKN